MKFTTTRTDIRAALRAISPAVPSKGLPITTTIHLIAGKNDGGSLFLTATDLDHFLTLTCPAAIDTPGEAAIPFRRLLKYISELPDDDGSCISFSLPEDGHILTITTCEPAGEGITTRLHIMDPAEFPQPPTLDITPGNSATLAIPEKDLHRILSTALPFTSRDEGRYILNGIQIRPYLTGALQINTTDGRRLTRQSWTPEEGPALTGADDLHPIIPSSAARLLTSLLGSSSAENADLTFTRNAFTAYFGSITLWAKLIEGKFPETDAVIPSHKTTVEIDREIFAGMVARTAGMEKEPTVRLTFKKDRTLTTQWTCPDVGDWQETRGGFPPLDFVAAFNGHYLADLANATTGKTLKLSLTPKDPTQPTLWESPTDYLHHVLMPMRVTE